MREFLETQFNEQLTPLELAGTQQAYRLFGLLPDTHDLRSFLLDLLTEQVAGYYDPATKVLYVVSGGADDITSITISHELVHALQDQYTPLDSARTLKGDNDRHVAMQAVIEGQAVFEQMSSVLGGDFGLQLPSGWDRVRETIPSSQASMLLFPYLSGAEFVRQVKNARPGGGMFNPIASSTEQILHPERYLDSVPDIPMRVTLPAPRGGTLVHEDNLGEFETRLFLFQHLKDVNTAARAAEGWDGDRYQVVNTPRGPGLAWFTVWDSAVEAAEFRDAMERAIERRFGVRPGSGGAQEPVIATSTVFSRFADRILKVQVVETGSSAKTSIGTGFFVSADGLMLSNFHVIAERIHEPENSRIEVIGADGVASPVEVIAVDVVHDLAVLRTGIPSPGFFSLQPVTVPQGERLYSLGHPSDLGLSIVEGTYNGNLQHTLYPKIHLTGSINPGMSGGPTITENGRVVGVNVSTMGEQRGFLVPRAEAAAIVARVAAADFTPSADMLGDMARQLTAYQSAYLDRLFVGEQTMVNVGRFRVVSEPSPIFRCWGDAERGNEMLYERLWHGCSTDDEVFIAGEQSSGIVEIEHEAFASKGLNAARFAALYTERFGVDNTPAGSEKQVTEWECGTRNVKAGATTMRSVLCLRRLKKLAGPYDAVLKVAVLGARDHGLISTLTLSGAAYGTIEQLTARYLELISWR